MWKDVIFCIIIIISIIILDFFIQNYIKDSAEEITFELSNVKDEISNKNEDEINEVEVEKVKGAWKKKYMILASVIEHDELEKVEKNLTRLYSALENQEKSEAISELDESIFILRHIKEKYGFKLENVF